MMDNAIPVQRALEALGALLEADGVEERIVVVGGAALLLLKVISRGTRDVDVIAVARVTRAGVHLEQAKPLPETLQRRIETVARDLRLPDNWMNAEVTSQWLTGLPPGLETGIAWRRLGGLYVGLPDRFTFICLKLYAAADDGPRSRHTADLIALHPSSQELQRAADWIRTQDPTIDSVVAQAMNHVLR